MFFAGLNVSRPFLKRTGILISKNNHFIGGIVYNPAVPTDETHQSLL